MACFQILGYSWEVLVEMSKQSHVPYCPTCNGTGQLNGRKCTLCAGHGTIATSTTKGTTLTTQTADGGARKVQTVVYLSDELHARLARYMHDKHPGKFNVRNRTIIAAIEAMLKTEGY